MTNPQGPNMTNARVIDEKQIEEVAAAIHDAEWEEPFSGLNRNGIEYAMAIKKAKAAIAALHTAHLAVVPMVATKEMIESGLVACENNMDSTQDSYSSWEYPVATTVSATWRAMLAAAIAATREGEGT